MRMHPVFLSVVLLALSGCREAEATASPAPARLPDHQRPPATTEERREAPAEPSQPPVEPTGPTPPEPPAPGAEGAADPVARRLEEVHGERTFVETEHAPADGRGEVITVRAYGSADDDHWHFLARGPRGWRGTLLTLRLARRSPEPPSWPVRLLAALARYAARTPQGFAPGHGVPLGGPIVPGRASAIRALLFAPDPRLGTVDTPEGPVHFLQAVGVTEAEHELAKDWQAARFLEVLAGSLPLLVTDPDRACLAQDPQLRATVDEGTARDGSSEATCFAARLAWTTHDEATELQVGPLAVPALRRLARGRIPFGRGYVLRGPADAAVGFEPAPSCAVRDTGIGLLVQLDPEAARALAETVAARPGRYEVPSLPGLVIVVEAGDASGAPSARGPEDTRI